MRAAAHGVALAIFLAAGSAYPQMRACVSASDEGQQMRDLGKYEKARDDFTTCSRDTCPPMVRRDCVQWLSDLNQTWPSVVVSAKDAAGGDLLDVKVSVDGATLTATLNGEPLQVDPGPHVFRYEAPGVAAVEQKVLVVAGEKARVLRVQFGAAPSAGVPQGTERASEPSAGRDPRGGPPPAAFVFGGVALLAFGSEAYFGLTGLSQRSSDFSQPCAVTKTCDVSGIRADFAVADISLAVGVASTLVAGYFFLFAGATPAPPAHVGFAPLPGGGEATFGGRF